MKIALILASNIYLSPYLKYYTDILDKNNIGYDVIYWNRKSVNEDSGENFKEFNHSIADYGSKINKIFALRKYRRYINNVLKNNSYDYIVVFSLQLAVILFNILMVNFRNKYILDIRDYNITAKIKFIVKKLVYYSKVNIISSNGYKMWLPQSEYILSHNCGKEDIINNRVEEFDWKKGDKFKIATIGIIRDFEANKFIIDTFNNNINVELYFIGKGIAEEKLKVYCREKCINNVCFSGYYSKNDELDIYKKYDIINNYTIDDLNSNTLMTNRFYNALIANKPMIFLDGSYMGEFGKVNSLGIAISKDTDVYNQLDSFMKNIYITEKYKNGRNSIINEVYNDLKLFERIIEKIITIK